MPAARSSTKIARAGQAFIVTFDIDFTGNYTTDGDVLDLTTVIPWFASKAPDRVTISGLAGQTYHWQPSTQKILGMTAAGAQFTNAAAYPEPKVYATAVYMPTQ